MVIKSMILECTRFRRSIFEMRNAYEISLAKPEGTGLFVRLRFRWEVNYKIHLRELTCKSK